MKPLRTFPVAVFVLLSCGIAAAQQQRSPSAVALDNEEEEIRRYSVELIVFEYLDGDGNSELFEAEVPAIPEDTGVPGMDMTETSAGGLSAIDARDSVLSLPDDEPVDETAPVMTDEQLAALLLEPLEELSTLEKAGFEILEPAEYQLDDIYNRLERLDAYRPLMRAAWIQPALEQANAIPLKLRRIGDPPLRLDGTVTLYLSRFLHLVVDMSIEEKAPVRPVDTDRRVRYFGDNRVSSRLGRESLFVTPSIFYRIQEDRILRNGELRYYDHPKFGVLAQVNRIEEETPGPADDTSDLLPANP